MFHPALLLLMEAALLLFIGSILGQLITLGINSYTTKGDYVEINNSVTMARYRAEYGLGAPVPEPTERILCSAIWYKEVNPVPAKFDVTGKVNVTNVHNGIVVCGHRHHHCILTMLYLSGHSTNETDCGEYEQGFLTSKNRFVSRTEAGEIAYAIGQTKELKKTLFSEDLW